MDLFGALRLRARALFESLALYHCDEPNQKQILVDVSLPYPPVIGSQVNYEGECYELQFGFIPVGHQIDQANVLGTIAVPAERICAPGENCPPNFGWTRARIV